MIKLSLSSKNYFILQIFYEFNNFKILFSSKIISRVLNPGVSLFGTILIAYFYLVSFLIPK